MRVRCGSYHPRRGSWVVRAPVRYKQQASKFSFKLACLDAAVALEAHSSIKSKFECVFGVSGEIVPEIYSSESF